MTTQSVTPRGFRAKQAAQYIGVGRSTFLLLVQEGKLPAGRRISAGCVVWTRETLDQFLDRGVQG